MEYQGGALAWVAAPPAPVSAHPGHPPPAGEPAQDLRHARDATRKFRKVAVARAAGYVATGECAEDPKYGGMGNHYANPELSADGASTSRRRRCWSTSRRPAAGCSSGRSSTSAPTPTRTSRPTRTGPGSSGSRSTADARPRARAADPLRPPRLGLEGTTRPGPSPSGTRACAAPALAGTSAEGPITRRGMRCARSPRARAARRPRRAAR